MSNANVVRAFIRGAVKGYMTVNGLTKLKGREILEDHLLDIRRLAKNGKGKPGDRLTTADPPLCDIPRDAYASLAEAVIQFDPDTVL